MSSKTQSTGDDSLVVFSQTCDKPYDRHHYEVVTKKGKRYWFDNWEMARNLWWTHCESGQLSHIDVVEPLKKKEGGKGF